MRRLLPLSWALASLVAGMATTPTRAAADREAARAAYAARVSETLRGRVYLEISSRFFRMESPRMGPGYARVRFKIDPTGYVTSVRVVDATSDAHARQAEAIMSGLRLQPPPEDGFSAEQMFRFR